MVKDADEGSARDRGCECVGYQAHDPQGNEEPNLTLNTARRLRPVRRRHRRRRGVRPQDPGAPDELRAGASKSPSTSGTLVQGADDGHGTVPGEEVQPARCATSSPAARRRPSFIVSHELPLDRAPEGYKNFDSRKTAGPRSCSIPEEGPLPAVGAAAPAADCSGDGVPAVWPWRLSRSTTCGVLLGQPMRSASPSRTAASDTSPNCTSGGPATASISQSAATRARPAGRAARWWPRVMALATGPVRRTWKGSATACVPPRSTTNPRSLYR